MNTTKLSTQLIQELNTLDAQYTNDNTPELAYARANVRLDLANISKTAKEQALFLNQAVMILEQSLISFDELPMTLYLQLSLLLAKCYFALYNSNKQAHFLIICEQILKPLSHHNYQEIYELLAQVNDLQNKPKLSQYWQNKAKTANTFSVFDTVLINKTIQ